LQQARGAYHIGLDEVFGAVDGAVHMALSRKVDHRTGLVLRQQLRQQGCIANVALHKDMARIALEGFQIGQIASVGEFV
jgi:hypothetical protein